MSDKITKSPPIRFIGFIEAWEQRKLGDVAVRITRKNKDLESTLPLTISAQDGLIDQNEFFNKTVASRDVSGYYLVKNGEFAYNKSYSNGYPWGAVKRLDRYEMGVLSTLYIVFKPTDIDSDFLSKYYDGNNWHKEVSKHAAEGARNHGLLNIAASDFFETKLTIPLSKSEQKQIGVLFKNIDNLITIHQRELELLKATKKSMLQKMFPKDGENIPEIRFAGFTDVWGQRKFMEVFVEKRDKTVVENEDILLSCAINGMFLNSELFGHFRGSSTIGYLKVKKNDLILSAQNLHLGNANVNLRFEHGIISPAYKVFEFIDSDPNFIQAWVKKDATKNFFLAATTEGASQCRKNIEWKTLYNQKMLLPSRKEQEVIGEFFNNIDNIIALHQRELDLIKDLKKSMLQKMFI